MPSNAPVPLLTAHDVAEYLGWHLHTVYNKVHAGELPFKRIGRSLRFRQDELDAWIEERTAESTAA